MMEDVTRKRIMRMLESLPEEQLYQVLDYIEFMQAKYAREASRRPDAFQQFAERVEDQLRVRSLAPKAMKGTMRVVSTANRMLDGVRELGRELGSVASGEAPAGRSVGESPGRSKGGSPGDSVAGPAANGRSDEGSDEGSAGRADSS